MLDIKQVREISILSDIENKIIQEALRGGRSIKVKELSDKTKEALKEKGYSIATYSGGNISYCEICWILE